MTSARWIGGALAASIAAAATSGVPAQAPPDGPGPRPDPREQQRADDRKPSFEGYDFGQVVATMETSVNPLQREMDQSFRVFVETIEEAEQLLEAGETHEAVQRAAAALDIVLAARDQVLGPMWDGQQVLSEQIATVRSRLATAVQASRRGPEGPLDAQTDRTLDAIAGRIATEQDPLRKKRLVAQYRTVRNLARIRAMAVQLSPDQRKMWLSVLQVLDEAALAHQRVMMGSEVLFAQFEATSANLRSYLSLMDTVDGAARLIRLVRGAGDQASGMAGFAESMGELQQRLAGFNESVEQALEGRMLALEAEIDLIEPLPGELGAVDGASVEDDAELAARIARVAGAESNVQGDMP
jgi:hypothetical protein